MEEDLTLGSKHTTYYKIVDLKPIKLCKPMSPPFYKLNTKKEKVVIMKPNHQMKAKDSDPFLQTSALSDQFVSNVLRRTVKMGEAVFEQSSIGSEQ